MNEVDRAEGLLDQIAEQALDDDYYVVRTDPSTRSERLLTAVATACFALMVTVAAVQTQLDRPATERQQQALAQDVETRQEIQAERRAELIRLKAEVAALSASADQEDPAIQALLLRTAGGDVRGPGIRLTVTPVADDGGPGSVSDDDLQVLVNGLWTIGAEAMSINGRRLGTLSSIRTAGSSITVNYQSINPPYVIEAIGDAARLRDRFQASRLGRDWQARADRTGLGLDLRTEADLRLRRIDEARLKVPHAQVVEVGQ